jgi:hypothetical protein
MEQEQSLHEEIEYERKYSPSLVGQTCLPSLLGYECSGPANRCLASGVLRAQRTSAEAKLHEMKKCWSGNI